MARIVYRGAYATFPMVGLTVGDLAYATDLLILYEWSGVAWFPYHDYPDYEGGKSRLLTAADWAAILATDRSIDTLGNNVARGAWALVSYLVPAGRTFYITQIGFSSYSDLAADGDNNQMCRLVLWNLTIGASLWYQGGNGGGGATFPKPLVVATGHQIDMYIFNWANHACDLSLIVGGYEV